MTPGPGIFRTSLPQGFQAGGINCGVRRYRPDLGLIVSDHPCHAAGVFTQSTLPAAPVQYCRNRLPATTIKAIVTNSGQANAATGEQGIQDNQQLAISAANALHCDPNQILTASTGVIGQALQIDLISAAMPLLVQRLTTIAEPFATAILTTDLVPKTITTTVQLSQGKVTITGICKGSGMIHPNMATMLGYLLTDAKLALDDCSSLLSDVVNDSFNMISVDGDTSTNDSVFLLANGASQVTLANTSDYHLFQQALREVAITLAKSIARDGEGATKLLEATVLSAPDLNTARECAKTLISSALVKTAVHGASPNWGRVIAHLGAIRLHQDLLQQLSITFQDQVVYTAGKVTAYATDLLKQALTQDTVKITINLHAGEAQATAWGCDLSKGYVDINADYLT